ncbi:restriction endonuclease subunit S [Campylobacter upsaliensis]|nr:restriction endonuclease subunit S [Campylobacter upsaliensis]EAI4456515.1 restriction endonuclease subunit S [Campylobacter upsaliensis]EAJ3972795.1 restriction endonuclease subunit S [Campylobacter upsaliensis]EAJ8021978.1 restriction endonuclease subunit S [Campylobacter upsaliensis]EAK0465200.1 restriction endonuclease subunit S [Campylobacter upsaliensis]
MKKHTQSPYESSKVSYKPSGIEWLGEIPQSWKNVSIRSCFTESNQRCNTDSYPLLSVTIANGIIYQDDIENKKDISNDDKSNYKIVPLNAVAYNKMRMWQGAVGVNTLTTGIVSPAYIVAIPNEKILPNFVSYLFKSKIMISEFDKNSYGLCLDMNNLRYDDFRNIKIPLPPLQEQKEIAEFLDSKCEKIQNYIDKKQKLITLLQEKKQALINEVVTKGLNPNIELKSGIDYLGLIPHHWEVKKLKHICKINPQTNETLPNNFVYIDLESVAKGQLLKEQTINKEQAPSRAQRILQKQDILFQLVRPYQRNNYIFNKNGDYVASTGYAQIRTKECVNFVYYALLENSFVERVILKSTGSNYPAITSNDFADLKIPLPPLQEQEEIAEFLDSKVAQIDSVIEKTKKQIKLIKEYKNTLINEAVCGRINLQKKERI